MSYQFENAFILEFGDLKREFLRKVETLPRSSIIIKFFGVYGIKQSPLGVYLAAEAESRWRMKDFQSGHATELWVDVCCGALHEPCAGRKPMGLDRIVLSISTNNHPPQQWRLLRNSPQTKPSPECLIYPAAAYPPFSLFVSTAASCTLSTSRSFQVIKVFLWQLLTYIQNNNRFPTILI